MVPQTTWRCRMKRFSSAAGLALAVVVVLGFAGPTVAGEQVPFRGKLEGDVTVTPAPPLLLVDIEATGTATQLGHFMLDVAHVVDPATRTAVGSYQFTAANGDTLYAEFTGQAWPTEIPGVLYIEETATITGGTGRFAGATGSFIAERWFDSVAGTTVGYFEGSISVTGSRGNPRPGGWGGARHRVGGGWGGGERGHPPRGPPFRQALDGGPRGPSLALRPARPTLRVCVTSHSFRLRGRASDGEPRGPSLALRPARPT